MHNLLLNHCQLPMKGTPGRATNCRHEHHDRHGNPRQYPNPRRFEGVPMSQGL